MSKKKTKAIKLNISSEIYILSTLGLIASWFATYLVDLKQMKLLTSAPIDTGVVLNTLKNLLGGNFFLNTIGTSGSVVSSNLLDVHSFFILLFAVPIDAIFNSPKLLYFFHSAFLYFSCIPIYLIALEVFKSKRQALLMAVLFISTPILYRNALGELHLENFGMIFFLFSYFFFMKKKYVLVVVSSVLALSASEYIATYYIFLGIMHLLFQRKAAEKKPFLLLIFIGVLWILFYYGAVKNLIEIEKSPNFYNHYFSKWNVDKGETGTFSLGSVSGLMLYFLKNPLAVLESILNFSKWQYMFSLMGICLFFIVINHKFLVIILPTFIYFVMNEPIFFHDIHSYYFNYLFVFSFISLCLVVKKFMEKRKKPINFFYGLLVISFLINFYFLFIKIPNGFSYNFLTKTQFDARSLLAQDAFKLIPPEAGVLAQHRYTYYLANRKDYFLYNIFKSYSKGLDFAKHIENSLQEKYYQRVDYIFVDLVSDQPCHPNAFYCFASDQENIAKREGAVINLINSKKWRAIFGNQGIVLLERVR